MLGCRWIGLEVRTSRRHTGPTACPGICRQHPSPRHQFSRECGSVKKDFQEVDRSPPSVRMLEILEFQINVCPCQAGGKPGEYKPLKALYLCVAIQDSST